MFTATGYYDTGFDIINIPATQSILRSAASGTKTFPALDILNKRFLSQIKVKISPTLGEKDIDGVDYIELKEDGDPTGIFYYVTSYMLTSKDVAVLNVVQDSFLTAGGTAGVSGQMFVKRMHVKPNEDRFGAFCEDDELLCPNEPLQLVYGGDTTNIEDTSTGTSILMGKHFPKYGMFFDMTQSEPQTVIQSTVDLKYPPTLGERVNLNIDNVINTHTAYAGIGETYVDALYDPPRAGTAFINIPDPTYRYNSAYRDVQHMSDMSDFSVNYKHKIEGVAYNIADSQTPEALNTLRAIGMEGAVIASYLLHLGEGTVMENSTPSGLIYSVFGTHRIMNTSGVRDNGQRAIGHSEMYDYDYRAQYVHNMRVLYGKYRKYVICSPATGSMAEAMPEELTGFRFKTGEGQGEVPIGWADAPYLIYLTEPRPTGRPYYNFIKMGLKRNEAGVTSPIFINGLDGAIAGGQWPEVPIVFTGMAGEFQARIGYELSASYSDCLASPERTYRNMVAGAQMERHSAIEGAYSNFGMNAAQNAITGGAAGAAFGPYGAAAGAAGGIAKAGMDTMFAEGRANVAYQTRLESANYDMLRGASGNYNEALNGNITANNLIERQRARDYERAQFELSTKYQVPRANFMATESMRDFCHNALFYARYTPTINDMKRMDKILDQFGYKVNGIYVTDDVYDNRSDFVYVEGTFNEITIPDGITGKKDIMQDINAQFSNGVRIWHHART